jgi:hypothetical protein
VGNFREPGGRLEKKGCCYEKSDKTNILKMFWCEDFEVDHENVLFGKVYEVF